MSQQINTLTETDIHHDIQKVIVDEVLSQGGSVEDLKRILTDKQLQTDLAERILKDQNTFIFEVNYDDPRWESLPKPDALNKVYPNVHYKHFPCVGKGRRLVKLQLLTPKKDVSLFDAMQNCWNQDLSLPDRAMTETFFDKYSHFTYNDHIVSICGIAMRNNDNQLRGCIITIEGVRDFSSINVRSEIFFCHECKFLVLVEAHPVQE